MSTADDDMRDKHGEKPDKWMPPKPEFETMLNNQKAGGHWDTTEGLSEFSFNEWYDKEIRPLFENAKQIHSYGDDLKTWGSGFIESRGTHKALLIKIEPIKRKSAEDLLRELLVVAEECEGGKFIAIGHSFIKEAKAWFEKRNK